MGMVKVDLTKREHAYSQAFDLGTYDGVKEFLTKIHEIRAQRAAGDMDASNLLLDFQNILARAPLTDKERAILFYLYEKSMTQKEVSNLLDISIQAVSKCSIKAIRKIAALLGESNNV